MQEELWPSREESAAMNLRRAISETRGDFVVEWIERGTEAYFVLFRRGNAVHREPGQGLRLRERSRSSHCRWMRRCCRRSETVWTTPRRTLNTTAAIPKTASVMGGTGGRSSS